MQHSEVGRDETPILEHFAGLSKGLPVPKMDVRSARNIYAMSADLVRLSRVDTCRSAAGMSCTALLLGASRPTALARNEGEGRFGKSGAAPSIRVRVHRERDLPASIRVDVVDREAHPVFTRRRLCSQ